jgi:hypothetical protein
MQFVDVSEKRAIYIFYPADVSFRETSTYNSGCTFLKNIGTLAHFYQTTWLGIPKDSNLHNHYNKNLNKSRIVPDFSVLNMEAAQSFQT